MKNAENCSTDIKKASYDPQEASLSFAGIIRSRYKGLLSAVFPSNGTPSGLIY